MCPENAGSRGLYLHTALYGVTSQNTVILIFTAKVALYDIFFISKHIMTTHSSMEVRLTISQLIFEEMSAYESVPYPNNTIHSLPHYVGNARMGVFFSVLVLGFNEVDIQRRCLRTILLKSITTVWSPLGSALVDPVPILFHFPQKCKTTS